METKRQRHSRSRTLSTLAAPPPNIHHIVLTPTESLRLAPGSTPEQRRLSRRRIYNLHTVNCDPQTALRPIAYLVQSAPRPDHRQNRHHIGHLSRDESRTGRPARHMRKPSACIGCISVSSHRLLLINTRSENRDFLHYSRTYTSHAGLSIY